MRSILFISEQGHSKALAERIISGGEKVHLHVEDMTDGKLFVSDFFNPETFREMTKLRPDVAIMDANFLAAPAVRIEFEKSGIPVYGSSLIAKSAGSNPSYIVKILNLNGIKTHNIPKETVGAVYSVVISGRKLASSFLSFEYTRLMNDDIGPQAAMGSVNYHGNILHLDEKFSKIVEAIIAANFSGKLDFMIQIGKDDVWCDGIHFYFKWNNLYAFLENINMTAGDFFYKCALNEALDLKPKSPWSCQITAAVPPFPYPMFREDTPEITGVNENNLKHTWMNKASSGELFTITSRGEFVREAKRRAYRTLSNLSATDLIYRTDIGNDIIDKCREIQSMGWLDIKEDALIEPFKTKSALN